MSETFESVSPQSPGDVLGSFPESGFEAVRSAVDRARAAQAEWRGLPAPARAAALHEASVALEDALDELVSLGVREVGKPVVEMRGEVARAVSILRYYAQAALDPDGDSLPSPDGRSMLLARRRPHGVVGLITPWNFPVAIPVWKLAPALAYGNAVVLKPAPDATAIAERLVEVLGGALPGGLLGVVTGGAGAGSSLLQTVDALSFTGSAAVGHLLGERAARLGVPFQGEMGGQNASIVLDDADLEAAARTIASAAMGYAGQKCTATSRVVAVRQSGARAAALAEALVAAIESLEVGDPALESTVVGPVITARAARAVLDAASAARAAGARVLTGGGAPGRTGFFVEPTLVDRVAPHSVLAQEEVFGPIAVLLEVETDEEALAVANDVAYGLAGAVFTSDLDRAMRFVEAMQVGLVRVNGPTSGVDFFAPFGGTKRSSLGGREQGKAARDFYTWTQTITIAPAR